MTVAANMPTLNRKLKKLAWAGARLLGRDHGHGRLPAARSR